MDKDIRFFDEHAQEWEKRCYPPEVRDRLEELIKGFDLRPDSQVLDVGSGSGVLQPYLRNLIGQGGILVAFDLSFNMVKEAMKKELSPLDIFLQGDVHHIPVRSQCMDKVICFAAFPHFRDPGLALKEMARVLKRGGELIIAHLMSSEELKNHHRAAHREVEGDVLPSREDMMRMFAEANLEPPEIVDRPGRYIARARKV